jgi:hypothetical protein
MDILKYYLRDKISTSCFKNIFSHLKPWILKEVINTEDKYMIHYCDKYKYHIYIDYIQIFDILTNEEVKRINKYTYSLVVIPGKYIVVKNDSFHILIDINTFEDVTRFNSHMLCNDIKYNNRYIVVENKNIEFYDINTFELKFTKERIYDVAFNDDFIVFNTNHKFTEENYISIYDMNMKLIKTKKTNSNLYSINIDQRYVYLSNNFGICIFDFDLKFIKFIKDNIYHVFSSKDFLYYISNRKLKLINKDTFECVFIIKDVNFDISITNGYLCSKPLNGKIYKIYKRN